MKLKLFIIIVMLTGCIGPRGFKFDSVINLVSNSTDHYTITVTEINKYFIRFRKSGYNDSCGGITYGPEYFKISLEDLYIDGNISVNDQVSFTTVGGTWRCNKISI